ncbi:hypothetical protein N9N34_03295 [Candidatus Pelagibacter bacterium]|jgi:hypothetical protein|nr:hypothetical protein [Candidatus Pelagibacter bacterium]
MALKFCRECKKKVSTEARVCPNCGVPDPTSKAVKESKIKSSKSFSQKQTFEDLLNNLWNGNITLSKTFWLYGVIGSALVGSPLAYAYINLDQLKETTATFFLIYFIFYAAYFVWVNVGIWNSSTIYCNFKKINKQNAIWGYSAKVIVAYSVLSSITHLIGGFN